MSKSCATSVVVELIKFKYYSVADLMSMKQYNIILFLACLFMTACSNDDEPNIPTNAIPLNMMIGDGETTIGRSDIHINTSINFISSYCGIADLGKKGDLNKNPYLSQIAQEVAVTPGNFYQITLARDIRTIAGARAFPINTNYYNIHVDSWIYDKNKNITGAKISYTECYPKTKQLPEWDSEITVKLENDRYFETATYSFPKGCSIDKNVDAYFPNGYEDLTETLKFDIKENQIKFSYPMHVSTPMPRVVLLVRYENIYTRVSLTFESSL